MKPGCGAAGPALGSWGYGYTGCTGMPVIGISWPSWGPRTSIQSPASMGSHLLRPGRPCRLCSQTLLGQSPAGSLRVVPAGQSGFSSLLPQGVSETSWAREHGLGNVLPGQGDGRCGAGLLQPSRAAPNGGPPTLIPPRPGRESPFPRPPVTRQVRHTSSSTHGAHR